MESSISQEDRLQLQKMIADSGATDQTDLIRNVKHSDQIRTQVKILEELKLEHSDLLKNNKNDFEVIALEKCFFIFQHYTEIYNKVLKDEIDLSILEKFLDALKEIEDGTLNQHEASVKVGKYLKQLYIDSALKKTEKNDKLNSIAEDEEVNEEPHSISWGEFKAKVNYRR